jgi:predicted nucleic acid-binding protein
MAIVIADTSPLQYLFQVGLFDLLQQLFETVHVPEAVRDELRVGRSLGFDVPDPTSYSWISVRSATQARALDPFGLGPGERAALSLALELGGGLVLLDDAAGRRAASALAISTTGTLGVLLLAKERGLITLVAPVLAELERRGFRITDAVRRRILQLSSE